MTQARGPIAAASALEHRLRVPRLRPRRPPRPVRRQLHRLRSAQPRRRPSPGCAATRACRSRADRPGLTGGQERALPQPRRRHVRGRVGASRASRARAARTASASARSTSTTMAGSTCTSRTIRIRARSTATTTTARSPTSASQAGCAYSQDGKPQAGMGVAIGDYDRNGTMDIFKTNFAGDTSTLYANRGKGLCEDRTFAGGHRPQHAVARVGRGVRRSRQRRLARPVPRQRPRLSRGRAAEDRGRLRAAQSRLPQSRQRPLRGRDRAARPAGRPRRRPAAAPPSRDLDNDGEIDVVDCNNVNDAPDLFRLDSATAAITG